MQVTLDISALKDAVRQLEKNYAKAEKCREQGNQDDYESFRTATIKHFELAYELSTKLIRRYLEMTSASPETADTVNFRETLRIAAEKGLIGDPVEWLSFRQERGKAAHTYIITVAEEIYERIPVYLKAFTSLVAALERPCT